MWATSCHRWPSEAAFLAACDAAGWSRGPDRKPIPGDGIVLDVIGPWIERPDLVDGVLEPGAFDPRWHVNIARLGVDLPATFLATAVAPGTPQRGFGLPASPPPQPPPVPPVIPAWKGLAWLEQASLLDAAATAAEAGGPVARLAFRHAAEWHRDSPMISALAAGLGLDNATIDMAFRDADAIRS